MKAELHAAPGRRERKKQEVERRIRACALQLFREKGYAATTVDEIADRADIAKGTFFNYFPRKDALLEALAQAVILELLERLGPAEMWTGTAREQLDRLFLPIAALVVRDPALTRLMLLHNMRSCWTREEPDPLETQMHELVCGVLRRAVERGELDSTIEVGPAARLIEAAYSTTMIDWLRAEKADDFAADLKAKFDIILRGLGSGIR